MYSPRADLADSSPLQPLFKYFIRALLLLSWLTLHCKELCPCYALQTFRSHWWIWYTTPDLR